MVIWSYAHFTVDCVFYRSDLVTKLSRLVLNTNQFIEMVCAFRFVLKKYFNKNVKNIFLSMRDVKVSLTFTSLKLVLI